MALLWLPGEQQARCMHDEHRYRALLRYRTNGYSLRCHEVADKSANSKVKGMLTIMINGLDPEHLKTNIHHQPVQSIPGLLTTTEMVRSIVLEPLTPSNVSAGLSPPTISVIDYRSKTPEPYCVDGKRGSNLPALLKRAGFRESPCFRFLALFILQLHPDVEAEMRKNMQDLSPGTAQRFG